MVVPDWLPGIVVVLPLVASVLPIVASLRYDRVGWPIAAVVLTVTLGLAAALTVDVLVGSPIRYAIGGVPPRYGVELSGDAFSVVIVLLDLIVATGVLSYTRTAGPRGNAFYSGYLLLTASILGITLAGDLFNLYVFLEILGISSYALISAADSRWSTYAAFKYFLVGTIGATLYLLGVGYLFLATGTLNMARVSIRLAEVGYTDPVVVTAFALTTIGLAIKIALFPLHTWLSDAHSAAPDAVSAIISGLVPAVAVYAFSRIVFSVYTTDFLAANPAIASGVLYGALLSLLAGNLFALLQRKVKILLAYSTISQFGLVIVGFAIANETAIFGAIVQLFGHGVVKGGLFILAGMFALRFDARTVEEYAGLANESPIMGLTFVTLSLTLIGLPPSVGFIGKWYIVLGAIEEGLWAIAAFVVLSTLMTTTYTLPLINRLYFHPYEGKPPDSTAITRGMLLGVALAAVLGLVLGLLSASLETVLRSAVESLVA
ncbi:MAG: proton-conducting transporter membrane subunit [Haloferacaceae archaeon]